MPDAIRYKSFDGLDLVAFSYGSQTPDLTILCLHGLTRNHKDFEPMIARLEGNFRFIAVDVRGRGESQYDPNPQNYIPPVYVRDVLSLLEHLQLKRIAIIGTSMGGIMSMLLMPLISNYIVGVVMNDIGPAVESGGLKRIGNYVGKTRMLPDWQAAADAVRATNAAAFPAFTDADWMAFAKRTCRENSDGSVSFDYDPRIAEAFNPNPAPPAAQFMAWRLFARMKKRPLLLIRGEKSDLLSARVARRMLRRHTGAKLVVVPGVGHAPLLNEAEVIPAIQEFLKTVQAQSSE